MKKPRDLIKMEGCSQVSCIGTEKQCLLLLTQVAGDTSDAL